MIAHEHFLGSVELFAFDGNARLKVNCRSFNTAKV